MQHVRKWAPGVVLQQDNEHSNSRASATSLLDLMDFEEDPGWAPSEYIWDPDRLTAAKRLKSSPNVSSSTVSGGQDGDNGEQGEHQERQSERPSPGECTAQKGKGITPGTRKNSRGALVCQVQTCCKDLSGEKDYFKRYRICPVHLRELHIVVDGKESRFCQQCGRFHEIDKFDGEKRSCRRQLVVHNNRRRSRAMRAKQAAGFLSLESGAQDSKSVPVQESVVGAPGLNVVRQGRPQSFLKKAMTGISSGLNDKACIEGEVDLMGLQSSWQDGQGRPLNRQRSGEVVSPFKEQAKKQRMPEYKSEWAQEMEEASPLGGSPLAGAYSPIDLTEVLKVGNPIADSPGLSDELQNLYDDFCGPPVDRSSSYPLVEPHRSRLERMRSFGGAAGHEYQGPLEMEEMRWSLGVMPQREVSHGVMPQREANPEPDKGCDDNCGLSTCDLQYNLLDNQPRGPACLPLAQSGNLRAAALQESRATATGTQQLMGGWGRTVRGLVQEVTRKGVAPVFEEPIRGDRYQGGMDRLERPLYGGAGPSVLGDHPISVGPGQLGFAERPPWGSLTNQPFQQSEAAFLQAMPLAAPLEAELEGLPTRSPGLTTEKGPLEQCKPTLYNLTVEPHTDSFTGSSLSSQLTPGGNVTNMNMALPGPLSTAPSGSSSGRTHGSDCFCGECCSLDNFKASIAQMCHPSKALSQKRPHLGAPRWMPGGELDLMHMPMQGGYGWQPGQQEQVAVTRGMAPGVQFSSLPGTSNASRSVPGQQINPMEARWLTHFSQRYGYSDPSGDARLVEAELLPDFHPRGLAGPWYGPQSSMANVADIAKDLVLQRSLTQQRRPAQDLVNFRGQREMSNLGLEGLKYQPMDEAPAGAPVGLGGLSVPFEYGDSEKLDNWIPALDSPMDSMLLAKELIAGEGGLTPDAGYRPSQSYQRISMKIGQTTPEELPLDLRQQFDHMLGPCEGQVYQGYMRAGCVHLVLDVEMKKTQPAGTVARPNATTDAAGAREVSPEKVASILYEGGIPEERSILVQVGRQATLWSGTKILRQGVETMEKPPELLCISPMCMAVSLDDPSAAQVVLQVAGRNLRKEGLQFFLRCGGAYHSVHVLSGLEDDKDSYTDYSSDFRCSLDSSVGSSQNSLGSMVWGLVSGGVFTSQEDHAGAIDSSGSRSIPHSELVHGRSELDTIDPEILAKHMHVLSRPLRSEVDLFTIGVTLTSYGLAYLECQVQNILCVPQPLLVVNNVELANEINTLDKECCAMDCGSTVSHFVVELGRLLEYKAGFEAEKERLSHPPGSPEMEDSACEWQQQLLEQCMAELDRREAQRAPGLYSDASPAHKRILKMGLNLLHYTIHKGMTCTADLVLHALLSLGMELDEIAEQRDAKGWKVVHLAILSKSPKMLGQVCQWGLVHGFEWNWCEPGPVGMTALHLAAAREDGGAAACRLLDYSPAVSLQWVTVHLRDGQTAADFAERNQLHHVNHLAVQRLKAIIPWQHWPELLPGHPDIPRSLGLASTSQSERPSVSTSPSPTLLGAVASDTGAALLVVSGSEDMLSMEDTDEVATSLEGNAVWVEGGPGGLLAPGTETKTKEVQPLSSFVSGMNEVVVVPRAGDISDSHWQHRRATAVLPARTSPLTPRKTPRISPFSSPLARPIVGSADSFQEVEGDHEVSGSKEKDMEPSFIAWCSDAEACSSSGAQVQDKLGLEMSRDHGGFLDVERVHPVGLSELVGGKNMPLAGGKASMIPNNSEGEFDDPLEDEEQEEVSELADFGDGKRCLEAPAGASTTWSSWLRQLSSSFSKQLTHYLPRPFACDWDTKEGEEEEVGELEEEEVLELDLARLHSHSSSHMVPSVRSDSVSSLGALSIHGTTSPLASSSVASSPYRPEVLSADAAPRSLSFQNISTTAASVTRHLTRHLSLRQRGGPSGSAGLSAQSRDDSASCYVSGSSVSVPFAAYRSFTGSSRSRAPGDEDPVKDGYFEALKNHTSSYLAQTKVSLRLLCRGYDSDGLEDGYRQYTQDVGTSIDNVAALMHLIFTLMCIMRACKLKTCGTWWATFSLGLFLSAQIGPYCLLVLSRGWFRRHRELVFVTSNIILTLQFLVGSWGPLASLPSLLGVVWKEVPRTHLLYVSMFSPLVKPIRLGPFLVYACFRWIELVQVLVQIRHCVWVAACLSTSFVFVSLGVCALVDGCMRADYMYQADLSCSRKPERKKV